MVLRVNCAVPPNSDGEDTENNPELRLTGRHAKAGPQGPLAVTPASGGHVLGGTASLRQWSPEDGMKGTGTRITLRNGPTYQDPARALIPNPPPCLLRWGG